MSKQIFRKPVPNEILFELLEAICLKTDKYYLFDMNAYKKMLFHDLQGGFCEQLLENYHLSKHFYLTRKSTFISFTNIVRQICKHNNIMFTSQIKYNQSNYNITYYVYF